MNKIKWILSIIVICLLTGCCSVKIKTQEEYIFVNGWRYYRSVYGAYIWDNDYNMDLQNERIKKLKAGK